LGKFKKWGEVLENAARNLAFDTVLEEKLCNARTFRPSGGSLVSLIEACSKEMGKGRSKSGGGSADRNSLCIQADRKWEIIITITASYPGNYKRTQVQ
jgi:hypothetical protein